MDGSGAEEMKLTAIDPGSNKCGLAFFKDGKLVSTKTLETKAKTPIARRLEVAAKLQYEDLSSAVSEEPLLMGRNNNYMQRLLGMIELLTLGEVKWVHPMSVKSFCGSGKSDKLDVALAAGEMLESEEEKEKLAQIIEREAWDESDAVAVGLYFIKGGKSE
jgi:Holliday junction resolvasome RuvABC endonuclease subunit